MSLISRWAIRVFSFLLAAIVFTIAKEILPQNFIIGAVEAVLIYLFLSYVWNKTKEQE